MKTSIVIAFMLVGLFTQAQEKHYFSNVIAQKVNLKKDKEKKVESFEIDNSYFIWSTESIQLYINGEIIEDYKIIEGEEIKEGMFGLKLQSYSGETHWLFWMHNSENVTLYTPDKGSWDIRFDITMDTKLFHPKYSNEQTLQSNL